MNSLNILSGGAAQGLVGSLAADFKRQTGFEIAGEFGAVGVMADKLRRGAPADIVILTAALLAKLAEEKIAPSPEADRFTLIKRVSYDLLGLPPTVEEADAFVRDDAPDEIGTLLHLAGDAAHESGTRTNAPLLCYLLGRARPGVASLDELAEIVRSTS